MEKLDIVFEVCKRVLGGDITKQSKRQDVVFRRWIYYKVARELTEDTLAKIGGKCKQDHATVVHGLRRFKYDIMTDDLYVRMYNICIIRAEPLMSFRDSNQYLVHTNINLRKRILELEIKYNKIPDTIKNKYA